MSGESGEGIPIPLNPKAESDINEALSNARVETLPKPPLPQPSEAPVPAALTDEEEEWDSPEKLQRQRATYKKGPWEHAASTTPDGALKFAAFWDEDEDPSLVDDAERKR